MELKLDLARIVENARSLEVKQGDEPLCRLRGKLHSEVQAKEEDRRQRVVLIETHI